FLDVGSDWVYLQCPLLKVEPVKECREILLEYLLRVNDRIFLAKFTLIWARPQGNPVNWAVLVSECPVDLFNANMFRLMTDTISVYSEKYYREILSIAREPEIAALAREVSFRVPAVLS